MIIEPMREIPRLSMDGFPEHLHPTVSEQNVNLVLASLVPVVYVPVHKGTPNTLFISQEHITVHKDDSNIMGMD